MVKWYNGGQTLKNSGIRNSDTEIHFLDCSYLRQKKALIFTKHWHVALKIIKIICSAYTFKATTQLSVKPSQGTESLTRVFIEKIFLLRHSDFALVSIQRSILGAQGSDKCITFSAMKFIFSFKL